MTDGLSKAAGLAGRLFLVAIFIMSGMGKIFDFSGTVGYMESYGMPLAELFLVGAIIFEVFGGLSILLGFKERWGAVALMIFLIPATFIFHAFWAVPEAEAKIQMIMFMKNMAIMGGLLLIFANGSGAYSLSSLLQKAEKKG